MTAERASIRGPQKVSGVGRDAEAPRAIVVYLAEAPTDDELRAVHEAAMRAIAELAASKVLN